MDGMEKGPARGRQQGARTEARRGWREPWQRYEESKGLDGVKDNSKDFSHKTWKCDFRAMALSGAMTTVTHLTQRPPCLPYSSEEHIYLWPNQDSISPLNEHLVMKFLSPRQTEVVKVQEHLMFLTVFSIPLFTNFFSWRLIEHLTRKSFITVSNFPHPSCPLTANKLRFAKETVTL